MENCTSTSSLSSKNGGHDWATGGSGAIEGLAEGLQVVAQ